MINRKIVIRTILILIAIIFMISIPLFSHRTAKNITIINNESPRLSLKEWKSYDLVSAESAPNSWYPSIAMNNFGDIFVTWGEDYYDIHINIWNATTEQWAIPDVISPGSTDYSFRPDIGIDSSNNVHVVWYDYTDNYYGSGTDTDIFYRCWNYTLNEWKDIEVVSTESTDSSGWPSLDIDGSGNVHVVWDDETNYGGSGSYDSVFYKIKNATTGLWTTTEVVSALGSYDSWCPIIAVDELGNAYVTWEQWTGTGNTILYRSRNIITNSWSSIFAIVGTSGSSDNPTIAVDNDLNVYLAWEEWISSDRDIYYRIRNATTSAWTTSEVISTESTSYSSNPTIAVDNSKNIHVIWDDETNLGSGSDKDIFYKLYNATSKTWMTTEVVSMESPSNSIEPDIILDNNGDPHVVWSDHSNIYGAGSGVDVFYLKKGTNIIPTSNSPPNIITSKYGEETINWTLYDECRSGYYRVWANNSLGNTYLWKDWTSWNNNTLINVEINRTFPGYFNYTIEYNDFAGQFGVPDTVIVIIVDLIPTSNHPDSISTTKGGTETINWSINDDFFEGEYRVLANNSLGNTYIWKDWTSWNNNTPLNVEINRTFPGNFNYTIEYNDFAGQFGIPDTVIVTISRIPT